MNDRVIAFPDSAGRLLTELQLERRQSGQFAVIVRYGGRSYASGEDGRSELSEEHHVKGGPVVCPRDKLLLLASRLDEWLERGTAFEWEGGEMQEPRLTLRLGRPSTVLTTASRQALQFEYKNTGYFSARWLYVVDRTCIEPGLSELRRLGSEPVD